MLSLVLYVAMVIGCNNHDKHDADNDQETTTSIDSLQAAFMAGWNNKDSAAIMNTMATDCVVMNDSLIHKGSKNIADNWVGGGVKVISNINVSSLVSKVDRSIAFDGGTYTLDLTIPGGPVLKERGNYSLVWTKQTDNEWKLTLVHIEDITRMPDIQ